MSPTKSLRKFPIFNIPSDAKRIRNAVERSSVERMRKMEQAQSYLSSSIKYARKGSTILGLIGAGILAESDRQNIVSRYIRDVPYSYPIPTLDRDAALDVIQPVLFQRGIYSRGRFGAWKYEVENMDHSVQMGLEAVNSILQQEETVVRGK